MDNARVLKARGYVFGANLTVSDLMSPEVITIREKETLLDAIDIMRCRGVRHLPVVDSWYRFVALITHRDVLRFSFSEREAFSSKLREILNASIEISDIATRQVFTAKPDMSLRSAAISMNEKKIGCLPVVDDEKKLMGILTEADFVRFFADAV